MRTASLRLPALTGAALAIAGVVGLAQIERLDLPKMVEKADNAVVGKITQREVIVIEDHPVDGPELYFTHLTIEGRSLVDDTPQTVVVTYPGGWIDAERGVNNSEAPSADEVRIGNEIVAFYKWSDNMGGDLAANALYASHGGLYRVAKAPGGKVVLGKGEGYAVEGNIALGELDQRVTTIHDQLREAGKK